MTIFYDDAEVEVLALCCGLIDFKLKTKFSDGSGTIGEVKRGYPVHHLRATNGLKEILNSIPQSNKKDNTPMTTLSKKELKEKSISELVEIYNGLAAKDSKVKKFKDKATAVERVLKIFQDINTPLTLISGATKMEVQQTTTKKEPVKISLIGRRSSNHGKKIKILVKENPRRVGTAGHINWELYKNGMTYEDFIAAGGGSNHLNFDISKGYVELN